METKTIGYILIGSALVIGGTAATIYLVKKAKDKKKEKEAKDAAYSSSLEEPAAQQQETQTPAVVTPKPKPQSAPAPTPAPTQTDNTFSYDKMLKSPSKGVVWIEIKALQAYLNTKGYKVTIDGLFGPQMRTAMSKAMGVADASTMNISLRTFLNKAASNFKAPLAIQNKISLSDFQTFFSSTSATIQDPTYPYQTPFNLSGIFGLPLFGL